MLRDQFKAPASDRTDLMVSWSAELDPGTTGCISQTRVEGWREYPLCILDCVRDLYRLNDSMRKALVSRG